MWIWAELRASKINMLKSSLISSTLECEVLGDRDFEALIMVKQGRFNLISIGPDWWTYKKTRLGQRDRVTTLGGAQ